MRFSIKPILGDWGRFITNRTLKFFIVFFLLGLLFAIFPLATEICSQPPASGSFSQSLEDPFAKNPDSVTCGHAGPGMARSWQAGLRLLWKSLRGFLLDIGLSGFQVFFSMDPCDSLYYSISLHLSCHLASGVFFWLWFVILFWPTVFMNSLELDYFLICFYILIL